MLRQATALTHRPGPATADTHPRGLAGGGPGPVTAKRRCGRGQPLATPDRSAASTPLWERRDCSRTAERGDLVSPPATVRGASAQQDHGDTGGVIAEVCQARQSAAWVWRRSFGGTEVAVLHCCAAPRTVLPGRGSMTADDASMSTWNRGRSNTSPRPTRRESGKMTCLRCSVESQTPSKALARWRFKISSCIRRSLRTAIGRVLRSTSTTPKTDPGCTRTLCTSAASLSGRSQGAEGIHRTGPS